MKAATMCEFSKQEFFGGLQALGIDSLEKFRDRMQFMRSELKDEQKFREIYNFAFGWAKEKGTASVVLVGLMAALKLVGGTLAEHTFLFLGVGEAGTGIAELIALEMSKQTEAPLEESRKKIWLVDSKVIKDTT
ncbi:NADP-dependent malic enzyme-like [Camellia sinensis]|nr:NADP-dependent malic enzyme-like [Camellia sinensis]XP_028078207.1 NADP-dependent malic enzyme-like [Camellia sinensis]